MIAPEPTPRERPPKVIRADKMVVANYLRAEATMYRSKAEEWRDKPDEAGVLLKMATQQETRAARFERVADWMVGI